MQWLQIESSSRRVLRGTESRNKRGSWCINDRHCALLSWEFHCMLPHYAIAQTVTKPSSIYWWPKLSASHRVNAKSCTWSSPALKLRAYSYKRKRKSGAAFLSFNNKAHIYPSHSNTILLLFQPLHHSGLQWLFQATVTTASQLSFASWTTTMESDARRNAFKARNQFIPGEVRRRRETDQVEIRKQKKEENLDSEVTWSLSIFGEGVTNNYVFVNSSCIVSYLIWFKQSILTMSNV